MPGMVEQAAAGQQEPDKDLIDLVAFVQARNGKPEVRRAALDIVLGLTGSPEGVARLKAVRRPLLLALLRLIHAEAAAEGTAAGAGAEAGGAADSAAAAACRAALGALVNLSQDDALAAELLDLNAVGRVMEALRDDGRAQVELLLMLLVNVTVSERGARDLLQLGREGMEGLHMALLLRMFVTSAVTQMPGERDPLEHVGALLTNATRLEAGRRMLLQPGRGFVQALASQLAPGCSLARRRGCAGALRNCCISAEADGTLGELLADEEVLARMLAPLGGGGGDASSRSAGGGGGKDGRGAAATAAAGAPPAAAAGPAGAAAEAGAAQAAAPPSPAAAAARRPAAAAAAAAPTSRRDPDDATRAALAEAVAVLATTEAGRAALWRASAPELLRRAYEDEEHSDVCRAMEAAARCLVFDAAPGADTFQEPEEGAEAAAAGVE